MASIEIIHCNQWDSDPEQMCDLPREDWTALQHLSEAADEVGRQKDGLLGAWLDIKS